MLESCLTHELSAPSWASRNTTEIICPEAELNCSLKKPKSAYAPLALRLKSSLSVDKREAEAIE